MTCPCGLTWLEFELWDCPALLWSLRLKIEIAIVAFALFPVSCDIPSLWHLSANQSDGQLTQRTMRSEESVFFVFGLPVGEVEGPKCLETVLCLNDVLCSLFSGKILWRKYLRELMCRICCKKEKYTISSILLYFTCSSLIIISFQCPLISSIRSNECPTE